MVQKVEVFGYIYENAYFYIDEVTSHGFLIDPGAEADKLLSIIRRNGWVIECILLTHGHFDHIGAVNELRSALKCKVKCYALGDQYLLNPNYNLSIMYGDGFVVKNVLKVEENDIISLEVNPKFSLQVLYTPGHTMDSCVFYNQQVAFVGDTIFKNSVGNTMFPGGDESLLWKSIFEKIFRLDDHIKLYSGHSDVTTVLEEKNRYL